MAHRNYKELFDGCEWMSVDGYRYIGMHAWLVVCIDGLVGRWRFGAGLVQAGCSGYSQQSNVKPTMEKTEARVRTVISSLFFFSGLCSLLYKVGRVYGPSQGPFAVFIEKQN